MKRVKNQNEPSSPVNTIKKIKNRNFINPMYSKKLNSPINNFRLPFSSPITNKNLKEKIIQSVKINIPKLNLPVVENKPTLDKNFVENILDHEFLELEKLDHIEEVVEYPKKYINFEIENFNFSSNNSSLNDIINFDFSKNIDFKVFGDMITKMYTYFSIPVNYFMMVLGYILKNVDYSLDLAYSITFNYFKKGYYLSKIFFNIIFQVSNLFFRQWFTGSVIFSIGILIGKEFFKNASNILKMINTSLLNKFPFSYLQGFEFFSTDNSIDNFNYPSIPPQITSSIIFAIGVSFNILYPNNNISVPNIFFQLISDTYSTIDGFLFSKIERINKKFGWKSLPIYISTFIGGALSLFMALPYVIKSMTEIFDLDTQIKIFNKFESQIRNLLIFETPYNFLVIFFDVVKDLFKSLKFFDIFDFDNFKTLVLNFFKSIDGQSMPLKIIQNIFEGLFLLFGGVPISKILFDIDFSKEERDKNIITSFFKNIKYNLPIAKFLNYCLVEKFDVEKFEQDTMYYVEKYTRNGEYNISKLAYIYDNINPINIWNSIHKKTFSEKVFIILKTIIIFVFETIKNFFSSNILYAILLSFIIAFIIVGSANLFNKHVYKNKLSQEEFNNKFYILSSKFIETNKEFDRLIENEENVEDELKNFIEDSKILIKEFSELANYEMDSKSLMVYEKIVPTYIKQLYDQILKLNFYDEID